MRRVLLTLIITGIAGAIAGTATYAAFSGPTANSGNEFTAGSVTVTDSHPTATPVVTISNLRPGTTSQTCIAVTYSGSLAADLRQYAVSTGALKPYLNLKVIRGSGLSAAFPSCTGFGADSTDYIGSGNGVVYDGTLASFPATAGAAGLDPTSGAAETWTTSESHSYMYEISVQNTAAAQGLTGDITFYWEPQSL